MYIYLTQRFDHHYVIPTLYQLFSGTKMKDVYECKSKVECIQCVLFKNRNLQIKKPHGGDVGRKLEWPKLYIFTRNIWIQAGAELGQS